MYLFEAHWTVGKGGRPAHMIYVNNKPISTIASVVPRFVQGPPRKAILEACQYAKNNGPVEIYPSLLGWSSRIPK